MTFFGKGLVAAGMLAMLAGGAGAAQAAPGFATGDVNLRAGPGTEYPAVATLRAGDPVEIYGCITRFSWCDINWRGYRGWAAGSYLQVIYGGRRGPIGYYGGYLGIPFITFSIGTYWNNYYRDRPFFFNLNRYRDRRDDNDGRDRGNGNNGPGKGNGPYIPGRGPYGDNGKGPTFGNGPGKGPYNQYIAGPNRNNGPDKYKSLTTENNANNGNRNYSIAIGPGSGNGAKYGNGKQTDQNRCRPGQGGACR